MTNRDRKELLVLRISLRRIAEEMGLRKKLPFEKLSEAVEQDAGWNLLAANIVWKINELQKERDAAINANADYVEQIMHDQKKAEHGCTDAYCRICDGDIS